MCILLKRVIQIFQQMKKTIEDRLAVHKRHNI